MEKKINVDAIVKAHIKLSDQVKNWLKNIYYSFANNGKDDSISLYDFIKSYQESYLDFMDEFEQLDRLDIDKYHFDIARCFYENGDVVFEVKPSLKSNKVETRNNYDYISITEEDGIAYADYIEKDPNGDIVGIRKTWRDSDRLMKILSLFRRYHQLFDLDNKLLHYQARNQFLDIKIKTPSNGLINGLSGIDVNVYNTSLLSTNYSMLIPVDLTDDMLIDYRRSYIGFDNYKDYFFSDSAINSILNSIHVSRKLLCNYDLDRIEKHKGFTKKKK